MQISGGIEWARQEMREEEGQEGLDTSMLGHLW